MRRLLFLVTVFALLSVVSCRLGSDNKNQKTAEKGVIDLTAVSLTSDIVTLSGEWEFYWQQLLQPDDFNKTTPRLCGYITFPGTWNSIKIGDRHLPGHGYATVRLHLRFKDEPRRLMLSVPFPLTSYRLWVNGEEILGNGKVGTSPNATLPQLLNRVATLTTLPKECDIIMQISNYSHVRGGLESEIEIGPEKVVQNRLMKRLAFDLFIIGGLFLMGFYHFSLYMFRKKDISTLYFSITCLLFALFTTVNGERFLNIIYPNAGWEFIVKLDYLPHYLVLSVFILYLHSLFPDNSVKSITGTFIVLGVLFSAVVLFFPAKIYIYTLPLYEIIDLVGAFYIISILVRASIKKKESARVMLAGFLVLSVTVINDILYSNQIIMTAYLIPVGFFVFIIFQSYIMSLRISTAFSQVEMFSEKLVALDKLKDEFMANTSHELRTPLNGIIGIAQSLFDGIAGVMSEQAKHNLIMIINSGKRLTNLINDILDFSHLKNKTITLNKKPLNLYTVVDMVLQLTKHLTDNKSITLINDIPAEFPCVYADEDRLQQIMINLIGNAIKYTDDGTVTVRAVKDEEMCSISIEDTGIGIPADQFERIFMPFEQASNATFRGFSGTGIGLAITKKLVELHGGVITVESVEGKGSKFTFSLFICDAKANDIPITQENLPMLTEQESHRHVKEILEYEIGTDAHASIMIVDDDPINLQVLLNHLSIARYNVIKAQSGIEALKIIEKGSVPDLILLDVMMPRMSGYDVAETIRKKYSLMELPILMLTAKNQIHDIITGLKSGANDYLVKPFDKDELLARVKTLINVKKLHEQILLEIERREKAERENQEMHEKLEGSLTKVLSGFIHICAHCKKIHDAEDWKSVEGYIESHTDAQFSHSICPDCRKKMYDDIIQQS